MKIAVFHHAVLGKPNIDNNYAKALFRGQMDLMAKSGLYENSNEIFICVNGTDNKFVEENSPPGCTIIHHGNEAQSLVPTFLFLEQWVKTHPDWYVCFWHMKGLTHPHDRLNIVWRRCMEKHVIQNWRRCVEDLGNGYDSVGPHWLTKEQYPGQVKTFFWGGAFYWVTSDFLACLPKMISEVKCRDDWFFPENWIGMGPRPMVMDYAPHWPGITACQKSL